MLNNRKILTPDTTSYSQRKPSAPTEKPILFLFFSYLLWPAFGMTRCGTDVEVIVIGAGGMGGLAAIEELQSNQINVMGLEASNRLGGRIHSEPIGFGNAMCENGASFLHMIDGENILAKRAAEAGIPLQPVEYKLVSAPAKLEHSSDIFYEGKRIDSVEKKATLEWVEKFSEYKYDGQDRISFQKALDNFLLENPTLTKRQKHLIYLFVEDMVCFDNGEELENIEWDPELISKTDGPADQIFYPGGYSSLVTLLAQNIKPNTILFNQPVVSISQDSKCVIAETKTQSFIAPYAISFLPLGVLKTGTINFNPPLSREKQDAIDTMGVGHLNKACYLLKAPLGEKKDSERSEWQFVFKNEVQDEPTHTAPRTDTDAWEWMDYGNFGKDNIVVVFFQGEQARQFKDLTAKQIKDYHLNQFKKLYPNDKPEILDYKITNWGNYPWTLGSYAYQTPNAINPAALSAPEELIFFGGEHTGSGEAIGTTQSAYISGKRTAQEVCYKKSKESGSQTSAASRRSASLFTGTSSQLKESATAILMTSYEYVTSLLTSVRKTIFTTLTDTGTGHVNRNGAGFFSSTAYNSSVQPRMQETAKHQLPVP